MISFFNVFYWILLLFLLTFAYAGLRAAPWLPTRKKDIEMFLKMADIKSGQKFYDLGCGDGRIVCAAAKAGANAEGFEISLLPYLLALFSARGIAKIRFQDFWFKDLSDADIVYFWLTPGPMPKLAKKLEKELKRGAKVICYIWPIKGWTPVAVNSLSGGYHLYLYQL